LLAGGENAENVKIIYFCRQRHLWKKARLKILTVVRAKIFSAEAIFLKISLNCLKHKSFLTIF
jgi:hypothetical protein